MKLSNLASPLLLSVALLWSAFAAAASPAVPNNGIPSFSTTHIARSGFFYVGGKYVGEPGKEVMHGAMYVEVLVPKKIRRAQPLVFLHGAGQTGSYWLQTPDGRPGWAHHFLKRGHVVYLVDLPGRGRSAFVPELDGVQTVRTAAQLSQSFSAVEDKGAWPQAKLATQWPGSGAGKGKIGDAVFDNFARSQVEYPTGALDRLAVDANVALLDAIGTPVILITHSLGGAFGWSIADARPQSVRAVIAIEPAGPPGQNVDPAKQAYNGRPSLAWGVTNLPITYEPGISDAAELQVALEQTTPEPGRVACYVQTGSPRKLKNLTNIPVLVVAGEAAYHRIFDGCTAKWLIQAGVPAQYVELQDVGLRGNGHQMMVEKNSDQIAAYLSGWLDETLRR